MEKRDISTQSHPDSHTHRDLDLNFQRLPPGKHRCTQGETASQLASYWVCVPLRAKTCPRSKPFMFLSTNSSLRGSGRPLVLLSLYPTFRLWLSLTGNLTAYRQTGDVWLFSKCHVCYGEFCFCGTLKVSGKRIRLFLPSSHRPCSWRSRIGHKAVRVW